MHPTRLNALVIMVVCIFFGAFLQHNAQIAAQEVAIARPVTVTVTGHDSPRCSAQRFESGCDVYLLVTTQDGSEESIAVEHVRNHDAAQAATQRYPLRSRNRAYAISSDGVTRYIGQQTYLDRQGDARGLLSWSGLLAIGGALLGLLAFIFPNFFLWRRR